MGKITVDFSKPGVLKARAMVADGPSWRQIQWVVQTDEDPTVYPVKLAAEIVQGLQDEKARVQNGASVPKGGM